MPSATPETTLWDADPHTFVKHRLLRRYLGAWYEILRKGGHRRLALVDGFCGPGEYGKGEVGSPVIALEVACASSNVDNPPLYTVLFIDERADRLRHLEEVVLPRREYPPNIKYQCRHGAFAQVMSEALDSYGERNPPPMFAFVDPFGFSGVPMSLLQRIMARERSEVFLTFMARDINRFIDDSPKQSSIVEFFGTPDVLKIDRSDSRIEQLLAIYQDQWRQRTESLFIGTFRMTNRNDSIIYYLIFLTKHVAGFRAMKRAMWYEDKGGDFKFSDGTNPMQGTLLTLNHEGQLLKQLQERFAGQRVTVEAVRRFVDESTIYLDSHMRQSLKLGETQGVVIPDPVKADGKKRIGRTFPNEVTVTFMA